MNKKIKVIELFNLLADGKIMDGQRFRVHFNSNLTRDIYYKKMNGEKNITSLCNWYDNYPFQDEYNLDDEVEIIEDEEEIDINDLEDLPLNYREVAELCSSESFVDFHNNTRAEINKIIKYLKQLDKKINKE